MESESGVLLADIAILLAAAVVVVPLFQFLRLGAVSGFVVAGCLVGPHGLQLIANVREVGQLSELGVVLLLFIIGIELSPRRLWLMRHWVFGLGSLQVVLTGAALGAASHLLFGVPLRAAVLIGPALALSSTAFVLQMLGERKSMASEHGRVSVAVLLMQDLAVVPLLALVALLDMPSLTIAEDLLFAVAEAAAILAIVVIGGRFLLQPVLHRVAVSRSPEVFTASAILLVLGAAVVMEHVGLSMAMGAFLAGLLIADSAYRHQVIAETQPFRGLLLGLFFTSMGMSLDIGHFLAQPLPLLALVAGLIGLKALILWPLGRLFRLGWGSAIAVALLLAQAGEFALVLFGVSREAGLIGDDLFQSLLVVVLVGMLLTPALSALAHRLAEAERRRSGAAETVGPAVVAPLMVVGFGRVGRRIGRMLEMAGIPYAAVDADPALVARERKAGQPVFFGDARRPAVLEAMGAGSARLAVVTPDDAEAAEQVVSALRHEFPDVVILARGHDRKRCAQLRQLGAHMVVSETFEASLELARLALARGGTDAQSADAVIARFRKDYQSSVDSG